MKFYELLDLGVSEPGCEPPGPGCGPLVECVQGEGATAREALEAALEQVGEIDPGLQKRIDQHLRHDRPDFYSADGALGVAELVEGEEGEEEPDTEGMVYAVAIRF